MGWVLRIILFLIVLRLVLRFVMGLIQGLMADSGSPRVGRGTEHLVRDPVCGTYLPRGRALTVGAGAGTRYFCSERCREAYGKHA